MLLLSLPLPLILIPWHLEKRASRGWWFKKLKLLNNYIKFQICAIHFILLLMFLRYVTTIFEQICRHSVVGIASQDAFYLNNKIVPQIPRIPCVGIPTTHLLRNVRINLTYGIPIVINSYPINNNICIEINATVPSPNGCNKRLSMQLTMHLINWKTIQINKVLQFQHNAPMITIRGKMYMASY